VRRRAFQHVIVRNAIRCAAVLEEVKSGQRDKKSFNTEAFVIYCVGLEHLLSRHPLERHNAIKEARRKHSQSVLRAERLQKTNGVYSPESLARVASESSKSARDRARKVAKVAASILEKHT
jgi:hypothetical protein